MNKKFIRIVILLVLFIAVASATGSAYNWESANLKVVDSLKSDDITTLTLQDKNQHLFKVTYSGNNLPDDVARAIVKYKTEFFSWRNLEMNEIRFVLSLDILEIVIIPTQIMYNGSNIITVMPAGMVFSYDPASPGNGLLYDFKILKDNTIVRMTGKYTTETEFDKQLFRIYDDPKAFLPVTGKAVEPTPTPTGRLTGTITGTPSGKLTGKPTPTPTGILATSTPAGPIPTGITGSTNGLTNAEFEFLLDKIIQLQVENEKLRNALLALENNKKSPDEVHPISREVIMQVIRVKRQYPNLSFNELFSQLRKGGLEITKMELYLILAVYFNEFNDVYL